MAQGILNTTEAARSIGLAAATLEQLRTYGGGPRYLKLGRAVRYRTEDLEFWLSQRLLSSTSEEPQL